MRLFSGILLLFIFSNCANKPAIITNNNPGWQKIAEATVDFKTEHREVEVIGADKFASLRFRIYDAPMLLDSVNIFFENDTIQKMHLNAVLNANSESSIIDLKSFDKSIRTISFSYRTLPNRKDEKARVEIWGLKKNTEKTVK